MTPPPSSRSPGARVVHVTTAGGADAELAADALWQAGAVAIEERTVAGGVTLLAAPADGGAGGVGRLVAAVEGRWAVEVVGVDLDAALDAWRPHARPVTAGRFLVRPPWVPPSGPESREREVVIDPGRAFGSGGHVSTRLALVAVDGAAGGGERVLDVGCGSGVLAIAALVAGAREAVGVDIDPEALAATRANAARNAVADRLTVTDSLPAGPDTFDLVLANMLAPTLVELAPEIGRRLGPAGRLVLSGLLAAQRPAVLAAYPDLTVAATHEDDGWLALTLRR